LLWLNLGIAEQRVGDSEEAADCFRRALAMDESLGEAWLSLGLVYYEADEFDLSEECYHSALVCDRANPKTWNNLGVLHFAKGDYETARTLFEEAVTLSPHFRDALINLRDTCEELGDGRAAGEFARILSGMGGRA